MGTTHAKDFGLKQVGSQLCRASPWRCLGEFREADWLSAGGEKHFPTAKTLPSLEPGVWGSWGGAGGQSGWSLQGLRGPTGGGELAPPGEKRRAEAVSGLRTAASHQGKVKLLLLEIKSQRFSGVRKWKEEIRA